MKRANSGIDWVDLAMTLVQVGGITVVGTLLVLFTSIPYWLCYGIAVSGYFILLIGVIALLDRKNKGHKE